jgi:plasmid stabilization system protein ParE
MEELSIHPLVQRDLYRILDDYRIEGGAKLADRFFDEAERIVERIRNTPEYFHYVDDHHRRANLKTFPYHFIYEMTLRGPRITVVRHHKRNPRYGMQRK